jgi:hypothetical protein
MMKRLLIFFVCFALLITPVFAQTYSYTCPKDKGIYTLTIASNTETHGTFDLYRQDGTVDTGSWSYVPYTVAGYIVGNTMSITYNGQTKTQNMITPGKMYISMYTGRNLTELKETRWIIGAGQIAGANNIAIEKYGITSAIVGFTLTTDNDVTYTKTEESLSVINNSLVAGGLSDIMTLAYQILLDAINFISDLIYWLRFFFIDNIALILALFLSVPMAFAAKNSRGNPERFMRQYFKTLRGFFEFIFQVWRLLTETIGTVIGWFRLV